MNLILNFACNNHCAYCFQDHFKNNQEEFTVENVEKVLQWAHCPPFSDIHILGGEPTLYQYLPEVIDLTRQYYPLNRIVVITNLLGTDKNIEYLYERVKANDTNMIFLINTTIDNDKKKLFESRLETLYNINEKYISLSITLMQNKNINKVYTDYIHYLFTKYPKIPYLRIGPQMPGGKGIYYNYNFTQDILNLIDIKYFSKTTNITIDCSSNYCMVSDEVEKYLFEHYENTRELLRVGCICPALDILPDFTARYCFSSDDKYTIPNIFIFPNHLMLENYFIGLERIRKVNSERCSNCELFIKGVCLPCHAVDDAWVQNELQNISYERE